MPPDKSIPDAVDVLVIGGGPAGLTAAIYLARFHRTLALVDAGNSRAEWIPTSHNYPGFPAGIPGDSLLKRLREQAAQQGVEPIAGTVESLERVDDLFVAKVGDATLRARKVIMATGILDNHPDMPDLREAVQAGCIRYCPVCDAFEQSGKRLALYGDPAKSVGHARFLRTYTREITLLVPPGTAPVGARAAEYEALGVRVCEDPVAKLSIGDGQALATTQGGEELAFDAIYPMLGCTNRSELAIALGAKCTEDGDILCDAHQQTSVPGLYAAGDVVSALNQVSVATGHATIAATHIHNQLPLNPA